MAETKIKPLPEIVRYQELEKPEELELLITPKNEFLEWYKNIKGILGEMNMKEWNCEEFMQCPNCQSKMDNYELNKDPGELWYLCPKCNLTFSHKQHQYFTMMIMRLIGSKKSNP